MITYRDFFLHNQNGTYICKKPNDRSTKMILELQTKLGLENAIEFNDLHTTLIYSKRGNALVELSNEPAWAECARFALFGPEQNVLVIELISTDLHNRQQKLMSEGSFISDWPDYKPHVSLSYNYSGELPDSSLLKDFMLIFEKEEMNPLKP